LLEKQVDDSLRENIAEFLVEGAGVDEWVVRKLGHGTRGGHATCGGEKGKKQPVLVINRGEERGHGAGIKHECGAQVRVLIASGKTVSVTHNRVVVKANHSDAHDRMPVKRGRRGAHLLQAQTAEVIVEIQHAPPTEAAK